MHEKTTNYKHFTNNKLAVLFYFYLFKKRFWHAFGIRVSKSFNNRISKSNPMKNILRNCAVAASILFMASGSMNAQRAIFVEETYADEEFQMNNMEIPSWEVVAGGPGKDGIPALTDPAFVDAKKDKWLEKEDLVIGITIDGESKAYPIRIMNYHEVVNDDFGGRSVAITYSPLCGSAMAYRTEDKHSEWELAVSGLLYNNNALYFDRQTESLWSQVLGRAVSGQAAGAELELLPTTLTTWEDWKDKHPETTVLSKETGFNRNYDIDSYSYYASTDRLMFPINHNDDRLKLKERIIGVNVDGVFKAYPYSILPESENFVTTDVVNGQNIQITFNKKANAAYVTDTEGVALPSASMYWFSWSAFHPETQIHGLINEEFQTKLSMSIGML